MKSNFHVKFRRIPKQSELACFTRHRVSGVVKRFSTRRKSHIKKYSCAISGMSIKMMKIDGRDSAEYQNWEKNDKLGISGIV